MANIWDLTGTLVAANYRKVKPSTQLGTRRLRFLKVVLSGGTPPDLTANQGLSDSNYSKAVLAMQNYGETWVIGKPSATAFVMVMSDDTVQDSAMDTNYVTVPGAWAQAEANVYERLGSWASGVVIITDLYPNGDAFSPLDADVVPYTGNPADMVGSNEKY